MTTELTESWYTSLIDELQDIITETSFTSRWSLIEGYHQVGTRILQENDNFRRSKIYGENIVQRIAESLGKSKRTLNYAIQFAREYPDLNLLPEGTNTSWHHIIHKYLTTGEKKQVKIVDLYGMIKEIKELLEHERLTALQEGHTSIAEFVHYLQGQVDKITKELEE